MVMVMDDDGGLNDTHLKKLTPFFIQDTGQVLRRGSAGSRMDNGTHTG